MDGATIGMIGGITGGVIGIAGGIVGTRASLKRAKTPAERRLIVRASIAVWAAVAVLALLFILMLVGAPPYWAYLAVLCAFFVALGPAIAHFNRRERDLQRGGGATLTDRERRR